MKTLQEIWTNGDYSLKECCDEILEWKETSILQDGDLRSFARALEAELGTSDTIQMAENFVNHKALQFVSWHY